MSTSENKVAHIAVCIPSRSEWSADFAICVVSLFTFLLQNKFPGYKQTAVSLINKRGSILPQLRRQLVEEALKVKATHLLFVDSDMIFPASIAHHLGKAEKSIIGCNCAVKAIPSRPTARTYNGTTEGKALYADLSAAPGTYTKVWRLGFGVMMVKADVFKAIPKPWFGITWDAERNEEHGEDWFFCAAAEKAGYDIFVDEFTSKQIGHIGNFTFTHDEVQAPAVEDVA